MATKDHEDLVSKVNEDIKDGWKPYGQLLIENFSDTPERYFQAMMKDEGAAVVDVRIKESIGLKTTSEANVRIKESVELKMVSVRSEDPDSPEGPVQPMSLVTKKVTKKKKTTKTAKNTKNTKKKAKKSKS